MRPERADLNILCWEGYEDPDVVGPFAEKHGYSVRAETIVSDADTAARVLGAERRSWDVVNLNNPFARDLLYPAGAIRGLPQDRFSGEYGRLLPRLDDLYGWTRSRDGSDIVGICQRFGPFNLVIDEDSVARETAESEGFLLADDPANVGRYGVLEYDDFNIFHLCFAAGLDPFGALSAAQLDAFEGKARQWFAGAALVTADHIEMNRALADGTIGFYLSGGMYTASPARREGLRRIRAVTPRSGPVDGKGGIVFLEVTSVIDHGGDAMPALAFLEHVLTPEIAPAVAFTRGSCNPITQMGDPRVFDRFTPDQLDILQWESLDEDVACCVPYRIPPEHRELLRRLRNAKDAALRPGAGATRRHET
ncbi:MAG: spermidine/putrescine ABC transporter substrate-binding protein [Alphaproteobacteria bacterium]|nr:spermidine/putrescine ABC transporter substrate-binding protein [Alphaproteobacteria bacterium]